jgi:hypothetical protein
MCVVLVRIHEWLVGVKMVKLLTIMPHITLYTP